MTTKPKGDCPFCDAPKWHVCEHFAGYVRRGRLAPDGTKTKARNTIPLPANAVCVDTGVSVRAYCK